MCFKIFFFSRKSLVKCFSCFQCHPNRAPKSEGSHLHAGSELLCAGSWSSLEGENGQQPQRAEQRLCAHSRFHQEKPRSWEGLSFIKPGKHFYFPLWKRALPHMWEKVPHNPWSQEEIKTRTWERSPSCFPSSLPTHKGWQENRVTESKLLGESSLKTTMTVHSTSLECCLHITRTQDIFF